MSIIFRTVALIVLTCGFIANAAEYGGGSGTVEDPYQIWTADQMDKIGQRPNDWDKHFILMADIDLAVHSGTEFNPIGRVDYVNDKAFTGSFDGNNKRILNLTLEGEMYTALFRKVEGKDSIIKDLYLGNPSVSASSYYTATLVGFLSDGTVLNCHVEGGEIIGAESRSYFVGGLVAYNRGLISHCSCSAEVTGHSKVGGLIGSSYGRVEFSSSSSKVSGGLYVGGLTGYNYGTVINCSSTGSVTCEYYTAGGLVGYNGQFIIGCFSSAEVQGGDWRTGSLAGTHYKGTIAESYANTSLELVGNSEGLVVSCYSSGTHSMYTAQGNYVEDLSSEQMRDMQTFLSAGWDFVGESENGPSDVWGAGTEGPILWWQMHPVPFMPSLSGGSGTRDDPYILKYSNELHLIGHNHRFMNSHFRLLNDIDMDGQRFFSIGSAGVPFSGSFDGGGNTIANLAPFGGQDCVGLFGHVHVERDEVEIKDIGLINPKINAQGQDYVGGLIGLMSSDYMDSAVLSRCYVEGGSISGRDYVGGMVGKTDGGRIFNCSADTSVSGDTHVGGLAGNHSGRNNAPISECYAKCSVTGDENVGGLIGTINGRVIDCYSTGLVSGETNVGGLIGSNPYDNKIVNCFWDTESSGQAVSSGGGATGITSDQMADKNTFLDSGWDFVVEHANGPSDIWASSETAGPPILWCQLDVPPPLPSFSGGSGSSDDPFCISIAQEILSIGHNPRLMDAHFLLTNDIDLSEVQLFSIGSAGSPFKGVFDGNQMSVSNASIAAGSTDFTGMFGYMLGKESRLKNLRLVNPQVDGGSNSYVGALAGYVGLGTIEDCHVDGGNVSGAEAVGGLAGRVEGGRIERSSASASVTGDLYAGGLVGTNMGWIKQCFSRGVVWGNEAVGGLVGFNYLSIQDSYATGTVSGQIDKVGGFAGRSDYGSIRNCYSTGPVSGNGDHLGGLTGGGGKSNSFWDIEHSGQSESFGGTGKTTSEMIDIQTYLGEGWDFANEILNGSGDIWTIQPGGYPCLVWECGVPVNSRVKGDFGGPFGVDFADFAFFVEHWLDNECGEVGGCDGTDLDGSGTVDFPDFGILTEQFLN